MSSPHDTDAAATIRLTWQPGSMMWHGRCRRDAPANDAAIGRAGPAGVVFVEEGELRVSLCYLSGRIEQVWIPATRDDAQEALMTRVFRGPLPDLDPPEDVTATRDLTAKTVTERAEVFRWARLHVDVVDPRNDGGGAEVLRLVELAATAAELRGLAPEWVTTDLVGTHLRSALDAVDAADGIDGDGDEVEAQRDRWVRSFTTFAEHTTNSEAKADAEALARALALGVPQTEYPLFLGGGSPIRSSVATALSFPEPAGGAEAASPSSTPLRVAERGDPPGHDATLPVDADGTFEVPELVARRFGAKPGRGRVSPPEPQGWSQVRIDAAADASPLASRWAVLYAEDGAVVGAGALRCTSARESPGGRVLVGDVARAGRAAGIALTTHPAVPLRPVGERPSLERAVEEARLAARLDAVAGSGAVHWAESALDWLQVGMVYRAAWAHRRGDADRFADGFEGDTPELETALEILAAVLASETVPEPSLLDEWSYAPAWWFVARPGAAATGVGR